MNRIWNYLSLAGTALIVCFNSSCLDYIQEDKPILLKVSHDGGTNGCGFFFYRDGTYKWWGGSALGWSESINGDYKLQDSIITLDRKKIDRIIVSPFLVIRKQKALSGEDKMVTYVYQVDRNRAVIPGALLLIDYSYHK